MADAAAAAPAAAAAAAAPAAPAQEEGSFPAERVEGIVLKHAENTIDTTPYDDTKIQQWINTITELVMEDLMGLNKPFKYVVSVVIMEQTGAGINTANSAFWDSIKDGCKVVVWPPDRKKNESITCVTTVYGLTI